MIKIVFTFLLVQLVFIAQINAQWSNGVGIIYNNPLTSKVGIGTDNPYSELEIKLNNSLVQFSKGDGTSGITNGALSFRDGMSNLYTHAYWLINTGLNGGMLGGITNASAYNQVPDNGLYFVPGYQNNWNNWQAKVSIKSNGNVGIGTVSPDYNLEVRGQPNANGVFFGNDLSGVSSPYISQASIWGTGINSEARISFGTMISGGMAHTGMIKSVVPANGGGHLVFQTREPNFNSLIDRFKITNLGTVGVIKRLEVAVEGYPAYSPSSKIEIRNNTGDDSNMLYVRQDKNNGGVSDMVFIRDDRGYSGANNGTTFKVESWKGAGVNQGGILANFITIDDGVTKSRLLINGTTGFVGVGTDSPDKNLQINSTNTPTVAIGKLNTNTMGKSRLQFYAGHDGFCNGFSIDYSKDVSTDRLGFIDGGGYEVLSIVNGGKVGIGTTNPGSFKLAVDGKIWGKEVQVSLTSPGPDYVFEKDYELPSLEEVKLYIEKNKHLPEVPSAKEMEANGVNLGEMNLLLLKKIEELTLYLLNQEEQIGEMKRKLLEQEKQIEKLIKRSTNAR